jgi:hypothetical protein
VRIDSGFYVAIGTEQNPVELLKQIRFYLGECKARGIHFERSDVEPSCASPSRATKARQRRRWICRWPT